MNKLIKIFSLIAFISVTSVATAQESTAVRADKRDKATELTDHIDRKVTLTADQRVKVLEFAAEYVTQLNEIYKNKEDYENKKKELDGRYMIKMREILTAEQYIKLEEMVNEQKAAKK